MKNPILKLVGQTAVYGLSSIIGRFLNYLLVPIHSRVFIPSEYGIVNEMYAYVSFFLIILTYGLETAYFRFSENEKTNIDRLYSTSLISLFTTSFIFLIIFLFFAGNFAELLNYPLHPEYIIWLSVIIAIDAFTSLPYARLRKENKAFKFAQLKLINIGINIFINLFFLLLCPWLFSKYPTNFLISNIYNPLLGIGYVFIANLLANCFTLLLLHKEIIQIKLSFDLTLYKQLIKYSFPLLIAGLAGMINETLDRIMLKYLIIVPENTDNPEKFVMSQIGIYSASYKIAMLMSLVTQAYRYAADPFFFSAMKQDNAKDIYANITKYFLIFGLLVFLGVNFYLDFIKYFIGIKYHSGLHIVPILLIANLCLGIIYNLSFWYKLTNLTKYGALLSVFGAFITIGFNILLIPKFGYLGAAWATFVCYFAIMLVSYLLGQKYYPVKYDLLSFAFYIIFALFLFFISVVFYFEKQFIRTFFNSILFGSFCFVIIYKENLYSFLIKINFKNILTKSNAKH